MTNIATKPYLGILPLRDHREASRIVDRDCVYAVRSEGMDLTRGDLEIYDHGDLNFALFWAARDQIAGEHTRGSKAGEAITGQMLPAGQPRGMFFGETPEKPAKTRRVGSWSWAMPAAIFNRYGSVLPIYGGGFDRGEIYSDTRYSPLSFDLGEIRNVLYSVQKGYGVRNLPLGTPGIVVAGSNESKLERLFFPTMGNNLVAQHIGKGAPDFSTIVSDVDDIGSLHVSLQSHISSAWRIKPIPPLSPRPGTAPLWTQNESAVCWNLDYSGGYSPEFKHSPLGLGPFVAQGDGGGQTVALASYQGGGPFDPGHATDDKHQYGVSWSEGGVKACAMNAGHIAVNSFFYASKERDAPLEFGGAYQDAQPGKFWNVTALRYDPSSSHAFRGRPARGLWRWETLTSWREPTEDEPPRTPEEDKARRVPEPKKPGQPKPEPGAGAPPGEGGADAGGFPPGAGGDAGGGGDHGARGGAGAAGGDGGEPGGGGVGEPPRKWRAGVLGDGERPDAGIGAGVGRRGGAGVLGPGERPDAGIGAERGKRGRAGIQGLDPDDIIGIGGRNRGKAGRAGIQDLDPDDIVGIGGAARGRHGHAGIQGLDPDDIVGARIRNRRMVRRRGHAGKPPEEIRGAGGRIEPAPGVGAPDVLAGDPGALPVLRPEVVNPEAGGNKSSQLDAIERVQECAGDELSRNHDDLGREGKRQLCAATPRNAQPLATPNEIGTPSIVFRPEAFTGCQTGEDLKHKTVLSNDALGRWDQRPYSIRAESVGKLSGTSIARATPQGRSRYSSGTCDGGLIFLPPHVGPENILASGATVNPTAPASFDTFVGLGAGVKLAFHNSLAMPEAEPREGWTIRTDGTDLIHCRTSDNTTGKVDVCADYATSAEAGPIAAYLPVKVNGNDFLLGLYQSLITGAQTIDTQNASASLWSVSATSSGSPALSNGGSLKLSTGSGYDIVSDPTLTLTRALAGPIDVTGATTLQLRGKGSPGDVLRAELVDGSAVVAYASITLSSSGEWEDLSATYTAGVGFDPADVETVRIKWTPAAGGDQDLYTETFAIA